MNPSELSTQDLMETFRSLASQQGAARSAACKSINPKIRNQQWAIVTDTEKRLSVYMIELYKRLGVSVPAEITNKPAFVYLAASRHNRLCEGCNKSGGAAVKYLNWITEDGMPLPLIQAHNGAPRDEIQATVQKCRLLCVKCARTVGVKFLKSGKPDLSEWR